MDTNNGKMDIAEIRKKAKEKKERKARRKETLPLKNKSVPEGINRGKGVVKKEQEETPPVFEKSKPFLKSGRYKPLPEDKVSLSAATEEIDIPTEEVYRKSLEAKQVVEDYKELLTFFIENEEFALDIMEVKEIIKMREVTDIPDTPPFVKGIISLRGDIIPVIGLRERFGISPKLPDRNTRIVITFSDEQETGLIVDSVRQVLKIPESKIEPPPPLKEGIDTEFIKGVGHIGDRLIVLIELSKVWGQSNADGRRIWFK